MIIQDSSQSRDGYYSRKYGTSFGKILSHYITVHISVLNSHWSKPVNFLPGWAVCCNMPTLLQNWSASYNKTGTLRNWACFWHTIQSKIKGLIKKHTGEQGEQGNKGNRRNKGNSRKRGTRRTRGQGNRRNKGKRKQEKLGNKRNKGNKRNRGTRGMGEQGNKGEGEQGEQGEIENGGIRRTKGKMGNKNIRGNKGNGGTGVQGEKKEQQEWCWSVNTFSTVRGKTNRIIYVNVYRNTINDGDSQTSLSLIFSQGRWGVCAQAIWQIARI